VAIDPRVRTSTLRPSRLRIIGVACTERGCPAHFRIQPIMLSRSGPPRRIPIHLLSGSLGLRFLASIFFEQDFVRASSSRASNIFANRANERRRRTRTLSPSSISEKTRALSREQGSVPTDCPKMPLRIRIAPPHRIPDYQARMATTGHHTPDSTSVILRRFTIIAT